MGHYHILTIQDNFSKHCTAVPLKDIKAHTIAHTLATKAVLPSPNVTDEDEPIHTYNDYMVDLINKLQKIYQLAFDHLEKAKLHSKGLYNRNARPIDLKIGQFVYVEKEPKIGKLDQAYTGPDEIVDITEKGNVDMSTDGSGRTLVYVDGSCSFNGSTDAKAGIGVWFADVHPLNTYKTLQGTRATNITAETAAAIEACQICIRHDISRIGIITDSKYLISCMTEHIKKWKTNGWLNAKSKPVVNQTLLKQLAELTRKIDVQFEYTPVQGIYGNEKADELAKIGSEIIPTEPN
ncbi:ribonuclease H-like [Diachasma alloeum]|uniref:ribonuclease H-like n=1 Tax=Diachasma alloeum TaxID=454923 RepID=UPI0007384152|nr:ribonuclease H-like [Diachasma alloeum]